jgi:hypothetical protein
MSDFGEGIAELGQGAMAARAMEPRAGEAVPDGHTHEAACLNCGTALLGSHCHACGQSAHVHRTMGAVLHDIMHGVLHLDGKIWHTLPLLAWRPGQLTRRYIDGQRARFVSPIALFLFSVFTMFAVFSIMGISTPSGRGGAALETDLAAAESKLESETRALSGQLVTQKAARGDTAELEAKLERARNDLQLLRELSIPASGSWQDAKIDTGWKRLDKGIIKWRDNPGLMLYKLQTNAYKFSWLLIPISLPFMWLLFAWRRRFGMYDHAIFVTYSIAFMSLLLIVLTVAGGAGLSGGAALGIFSIAALLHIYRHLKGTYELSHFSAAWRTMVLTLFITVFIVGLFGLALVMLGLVG